MAKRVKEKRRKLAKAVSLYPLTLEKAIADVFKIDAKKLAAAEQRKAKRKK